MVFQPGQSGNPKGRPKGRIRRVMFEEWADKNALLETCQKTLLEAMLGKERSKVRVETARYVLEQLIGKPPQTINHGMSEDGPISIKVAYA